MAASVSGPEESAATDDGTAATAGELQVWPGIEGAAEVEVGKQRRTTEASAAVIRC